MSTSSVWSIHCIAVGLFAMTALPVVAQLSSGGTPPKLTEGKGGPSSAQSGEPGPARQGQAGIGNEQSPTTAPGARIGGGSSDQGAKGPSSNMETVREGSGEQRGRSMRQAQRSGGSQGSQEQMYEDRMKGVQ